MSIDPNSRPTSYSDFDNQERAEQWRREGHPWRAVPECAW